MSENRPAAQVQRSKSGLYYGYVIAIAAFFIFIVVQGTRFSFGVFFTPMIADMGWSNATTSLAYSISTMFEGCLAFASGWLTDRYGPRITLTISGILLGLGYCLIPLVHSPWQLYLFYGIIIGAGQCCIYVPLISVVIIWFKSRRSLIVGFVGSGISIGVLIMAPVATRLIEVFQWRTAFFIVGIVIFIVVIVAAQFLKRDSSTSGLPASGEAASRDKIGSSLGYFYHDIIRTNQFWLVFFVFFCFTFSAFTLNIFIVPDAIKFGVSATIAATLLSTYGGLQMAGRLGLGSLADRIGNRSIYILGFIITAASLLLVILSHELWSFYLFAAIFGTMQGGMFTAQAPIVASLFGSKSFGVVLGLTGIGFTLGGALGPYLTGRIFDGTGSYETAFIVCAGVSLIGLIITLLLKPLKDPSPGTIKL